MAYTGLELTMSARRALHRVTPPKAPDSHLKLGLDGDLSPDITEPTCLYHSCQWVLPLFLQDGLNTSVSFARLLREEELIL